MKNITLCADDYGQNQSISQAIIALLEKNRLSATSCMTTGAKWPEYAKWLHPWIERADIGLHFNLTEGHSLSGQLAFLPLSKLLFKAYWRFLKQSAIEAELHAQLDAFESALGRLPDFVDGHQHIHQLPVIRQALFHVYEKRLRSVNCYLRCVYHPRFFLRPDRFKEIIIQLLGARAFKKMAMRGKIPHNSSFSGIYPFADRKPYSQRFPRFLAEVSDGGIIMCHPGLSPSTEADMIAEARYREFLYLESDAFVMDCFHAGVSIKKRGV